MASKIVVGEVIAKRIYELVTKLSGDIDTANDYLALDNQNDDDTKKISLGAVAAVLGALVAASSDDTTPGFLDDKLVVETGLLKTILNPSGNEEIQIGLGKDDTFQLLNSADTSKVLKFLLSGITTGTTRTLTIPDKSGLLAVYGMLNEFSFGGQAHGGSYTKTFTASATFNANDGNNQRMVCTGDTTIGISDENPGVFIFDLPISGSGVSTITIGASFGTAYPNNDILAYTDGSINTITLYVNPNGDKRYTITTIEA